jgi:WD40 repeat protein
MVSDQKQTIISKAPGHMLDVAISNDGTLLAAASASGVIEIYDLATLELLQTLDTHTSKVNQITFSNDQKYLISGSDDGTVRIWGLQP